MILFWLMSEDAAANTLRVVVLTMIAVTVVIRGISLALILRQTQPRSWRFAAIFDYMGHLPIWGFVVWYVIAHFGHKPTVVSPLAFITFTLLIISTFMRNPLVLEPRKGWRAANGQRTQG